MDTPLWTSSLNCTAIQSVKMPFEAEHACVERSVGKLQIHFTCEKVLNSQFFHRHVCTCISLLRVASLDKCVYFLFVSGIHSWCPVIYKDAQSKHNKDGFFSIWTSCHTFDALISAASVWKFYIKKCATNATSTSSLNCFIYFTWVYSY